MAMTLLAVKKLNHVYGGFKALEDVTFNLEEGDFLGLLGPNGSGKTTLIHCLCGLMKPTSGTVNLDGARLDLMDRKEMARKVSLVPQSTMISFDFSVQEIIMMGRNPYLGRYWLEGKNDREIVNSVIKEIGIEHLAQRSARTLSGGELQKVILARALAQSTRLMLLDEPTVHLDVKNQIEIMELLKKFNEERGITILTVLHDLNLAAQYCKKLILMKQGRIIDIGSPREVLNTTNIREAYNIEVIVKEHPLTSSIYLLPYSRSIEMPESSGRIIHLICGGGSGSQLMKMLTEKSYKVTAGVLNVLDEDFKTAETLKMKVVDEAPFSEITEEALRRNIELIKTTEMVLLTSLWIGHGNIRNLEAALEAIKLKKPLILIESSPIEDRNFYGDEALNLYEEIKRDAITVKNEKEALKIIESLDPESSKRKHL